MTDHTSHSNSNIPDESLAERVLGRIDTEHIAPRPRWAFVAENWFFWTCGALAVAVGSLASAAVLFELANAGWSFYAATHPDLLTFVLAAAPFLWLFILAVFIFIGYENIRRTKHGYRYPFTIIILGAVLTSIALGAALFAAGFGEEVDEAIGDHPPFYRPVIVAAHAWWLHPDRGLLGGQVVAVSAVNDTFTLKDFNGNIWIVDASGLSTTSLAAVERGGIVRVEGIPDANATSSLVACAVFPWTTYGADTNPPPPAPFAPIPPVSERTSTDMRSQICRGASPYGSPSATSGD
jgi:hypothetical protein